MESGIKLNIKDNEVVGVLNENDPNGPCVAGIEACRHADNWHCLAAEGQCVFGLKRCPLNKWVALKLFPVSPSMYGNVEDGACFICGEKKFWSRTPDSIKVCTICHPPAVKDFVVRKEVASHGG